MPNDAFAAAERRHLAEPEPEEERCAQCRHMYPADMMRGGLCDDCHHDYRSEP